MKVDEGQALDLVLTTIRQEADDLGYDELRDARAETSIYGGDTGIDSLSLVRLIASIERAAERKFDRRVVLADEKAMSMRSSPFRTAATLASLLHQRLGQRPGDSDA
jgi:acyl carrier protein